MGAKVGVGVVLGCVADTIVEPRAAVLLWHRRVQGDLEDMRALRQAFRHSGWLRTIVGALVVFSLVFAGPALAQDVEGNGEDDFLNDDFLDDDAYEDDFLADDFAETVEEAIVQEKGVYYWTFEVPVDVLVLRPIGALDVAVGGMFVAVATLPILLGATGEMFVEAAMGEGWFFDTTNLDAALTQAVIDPSDFVFERPLGQLVSL